MRCAHFVEVDVRTSRDGILVIMHDPTVDRTTRGTGRVSDLTLAELKALDAGRGESIPTLEEVLSLVEGRCGLVVELKEERDPRPVLELIGKRTVDPLLIVSFHADVIKEVKRMLRRGRTGFIFSRPSSDPLVTAMVIHADMIFPRFTLVTPALVEDAHFRGMMVVPWTLNSREEILKAAEAGVDGFATDDPCRARTLLEELRWGRTGE
jgi:glycerophosphoryl diester phosphodiesterase